MTILLFGVSNVGKSTTGKLLAERLGYTFYDLDEEVKRRYNITLEEFVNTGTLRSRDEKRCRIIKEIIQTESKDKVIAVTPISYLVDIQQYLSKDGVLAIELRDTPENIFDRLVFSDENDKIYYDDDYKNRHKAYYLSEIYKDLKWYGHVNSIIKNKFDIKNVPATVVVDRIIEQYHLASRRE